MIVNLPKQFPLDNFEKFTFGDVEPQSDSLLDHVLGVCMINPVREFLKGRKSLIVGFRGTGKSTLFKLVSEGKLNFAKRKNYEDIILAIDESLDYAEVKFRIFESFNTPIGNEVVKGRYFWEIYILFRLLIKIEGTFSDLPDTLKKNLHNIKIILGYQEKKVSIKNMLASLKYTGGLKVSQMPHDIAVTPQVSVERSNSSEETKMTPDINFNIEACKKEIDSFLNNSKYRIFMLIDNLDEFVVTEAYASQKILIQGLLECERGYVKHVNIKLKLFLRSDLFERLDFETLGYEKVSSRKIDLVWNNQDIRKLVAQRIMLNFFELFGLDHLVLSVDEEKLYLDELSAGETSDIVVENKRNFFEKIEHFITNIFRHPKRDTRIGRHINFNDAVNSEIITSIFPRKVKHRTSAGKMENCDFIDFCESHLCLSGNLLTPRLIIMFIEKCLECAKNYYRENPDIKIELDENSEFPLIKKDCVYSAYALFCKELWKAFNKNIPYIWKPFFDVLQAKKGAKHKFQYKDLEKILNFNDPEQLRQFIAFLCHVGLFECQNPFAGLPDRVYALPIALR